MSTVPRLSIARDFLPGYTKLEKSVQKAMLDALDIAATVPAPGTLTLREEDPVAHEQDLQRERCLLFVACTRARDALRVSCSGSPSQFLT
jgi:superfamily I DNA/RNA helicase